MQAFDEKRTKNNVIKRMIQLGLIADRSEIVPQKTKKSRPKKQQSDVSGTEDSDEEIAEQKPKRKSKPKPAKKPQKSKTIVKTPLDIGTVKFLIAQCDEKFKEALDWLKEGIKDASEDFEEVSEDNDDGVPLLPLQPIEKEAVDDETFKRLLIALGIQPPIEGTDTYWKIPVYLNAADLKVRFEVLDGTYNPAPSENASTQGKDDDSDANQDPNEDTASSASDDNDNDEDDSANDSDSHANFLSKRREHFDNLVFNQSDNEDEHRAPLKPRKGRKSTKAGTERVNADSKPSKGRGRSKKIDINEMLMEGGSQDDKNRENSDADNENPLEDFDSENLRKRLAELVDDDDDDAIVNDDGAVDNILGNSKSEKTRRVRRNVIESDSSDDEVENKTISNQDNLNAVDRREKDDQLSASGNNEVDKRINTTRDDSQKQHVDVHNQSSTSLANSSGELGDIPNNSLRMSPTPEDDDYDANINAETNIKRTRNDVNGGSEDLDEEGVVAKKQKIGVQDIGARRWAALIDEDSD